MAEKRYSREDEAKRTRDTLADLRAKGIDAREIHAIHPGGMKETLKHLTQNISCVRDQSQAQTEVNHEKMRQSTRSQKGR
jgi:hypothetical protein